MKCSKCKKKNIKVANYCKWCGHKFTKEEKDEYNKKEHKYWLYYVKKAYDVITLKVITDSKILQALYVLVILLFGFYMVFTMGSNLKIIETKNYDVKYNKSENEYYVLVGDDIESVSVKLYVPNRIKKLRVFYLNESNEILDNTKHNKSDEITLKVNENENNFYLIEDNSNRKEKIKVYVYDEALVRSGGEKDE